MLHTVWHTISVIGIVIAIFVAIVVLILLLALFFPVRYTVVVDKNESQTFESKVRISWLMRLLSMNIIYEDGKTNYKVRFLGLPLGWIYKCIINHKKKRVARKEARRSSRDIARKVHEQKVDNFDSKSDLENVSNADVIKNISNNQEELDNAKDDSDDKKSIWEKIRTVIYNIMKYSSKIIYTALMIPYYVVVIIEKIVLFVKRIITFICESFEKIVIIKEFLQDERNRESIKFVRDMIKLLYKKIKPKKSDMYIRYGTGDPASTGQLLGIVAATNGLHQDVIKVVPDFNEKVLEIHMYFKGKIKIFDLVVMYYKIFRDKKYIRLQRRVNRLKEEIL